MNIPTSATSLQGWLQWLELLHPSTIDLGLERVTKVANRLRVHTGKSRIITIGGTNGKGSTLAMLAALLRAAGYTVASYTSPHLLKYNERVCLNGKPGSDQELCQAFAAVEEVRQDVSLTYFEFGTLAALLLFSAWQPDFILLEVGLGGRLDAVNIVDPEISILTNVQLDHMDWLGATREAIAVEKAGIFRTGKAAIYGERDMPEAIRQQAELKGACLQVLGRDFDWSQQGRMWQWQGTDSSGNQVTLENLPGLAFPHDNAACVLQAMQLLQLTPAIADPGRILAGVTLPGRFQQVDWKGRQLILDVAHNPHAAANLVRKIAGLPGGKANIVLAMLGDKDIAAVVSLLAPATNRLYVAPLGGERGAPAEIIYNCALDARISHVSSHDSVVQALESALAESDSKEPVLVTGSFFTVAAVLELI